jgi:hypothetical protein
MIIKIMVRHEPVYQIMKERNFLLPRHGKKEPRAYDRKITTLKINTRWCVGAFLVQYFNGDRVHIAVLGINDLEVVTWRHPFFYNFTKLIYTTILTITRSNELPFFVQ